MNPSGENGLGAFLLRQRGRISRELAEAFETTPRGGFLPGAFADAAWSERMVPIECGEAIEGVDLQARVLQSLAIEPGHRVLEIGTGSGYTAAIMARLSARVTTVERFRTLVGLARTRMEELGLAGVNIQHHDGSNGYHINSPYDRIVVWAAFDSLPRSFADQLATNGIMIAPIGPADDEQNLARLTKVGSRFDREDIAKVRFQPVARALAATL